MQKLPLFHAELVAAVLASPDDDAPRLVYADWLQERGDPRGELIAIQVELAVMRRDPSGDWARPAHAQARIARENALLREHLATWARPYHPIGEAPGSGPPALQFDRGFVHAVRSRAEAFIDRAFVLFEREPVVRATIRDVRASASRLLAAVPELERLRTLFLEGTLTDDDAAAIASSRHSVSLVELGFLPAGPPPSAGTRIGDGGARALAESPHLARLERLLLPSARIGDDGALALAASRSLPRLGHLDLRGNAVGDGGLRALASSATLPPDLVVYAAGNPVRDPAALLRAHGDRVVLD